MLKRSLRRENAENAGMGWDPDAPSLTCAEASALYERINQLEGALEKISKEQVIDILRSVTGQLRHAYMHLNNVSVIDQKSFADGLISPQIKKLEDLTDLLQAITDE
jgi:hypothetical protein